MSNAIPGLGGDNKFDRIIKEMMIKKEPLHSLADCLDCYSQQFLSELAERIGVRADDLDKPQLIEATCKSILERKSADILFDDLTDLKRYTDICRDHSKDAELEVFSGIFKYLIRGWMFFFTGENGGHVKLTMPDEIMSFVSEYLADGDKLENAERTKELLKYLWGLDHLYGAYEKKQFIEIWNKHHNGGKELTEEELNTFIKDVQSRYPACHEEGDYIISNSFTEYHVCTELLRSTQGKEYYMPTPDDIETLQSAKVDLNLPQYTAIKHYLSKKLPDDKALDNTLYLIESYVVIESAVDDVMMALNLDNVAFDTPSDAQDFLDLYSDLANSVRLWTQRGFTAEEKGCIKSYSLSDISSHVPVKYKKVGRNDPCPCGSGKKYKNCCGKLSFEDSDDTLN